MVDSTAPQGYLVAESITFRVNLDGSVEIKDGENFVPAFNATVHMEDAFAPQSVTFSKTEVNGTAELPGASLQVFRGETADATKLIEEWVSTDTAKVIELIPGIYTMVERTAPKGYEIAESITFRVNLDGTVDIKHAANWVPAKNATVRMQDAKTPEPAKPVDPSYPTLNVPLSVRKTLKNGSLKAGEFTFILKDGAGRVIAEASNDAQGVVTFPDRTFSRVVKNYKYTIEEKPGDAKNTTYDDTVFTVLVSTNAVNDKLEATVDVLKNNVPYAGDVHFVNTRKAPATGDATMNTILLLVMLALTLGAGSLVLRRIQRTQEHKNQG